jgi:hypothetical protein
MDTEKWSKNIGLENVEPLNISACWTVINQWQVTETNKVTNCMTGMFIKRWNLPAYHEFLRFHVPRNVITALEIASHFIQSKTTLAQSTASHS